MNELDIVKSIVDEAERVVFFGGAGVSCASGIPDFRSSDGLYSAETEHGERPEEMLHISYLQRKPKEFFEYYKSSMLYPDAKPNAAHKALAKLEKMGKLRAVVTQNIDGLHGEAGSGTVYELHGSVARNYCIHCGSEHSLEYVVNSPSVPKCGKCGGIVRPDVVLYGEGLDGYVFAAAERAIASADVLIVGGTSLTVNPAASLVAYFGGEHFIIINKTPTPYDLYAEMIIREPIEEVLAEAVEGILR
jgi:NAD-dependent deacetylase